jgi:prepilin-type N-terminal cleavage/methylation domain-containing protein
MNQTRRPTLNTNQGFTLIEMLISMAIFGVIAFLTFMLVSGALTYNARQQATTAAQGKLRRITEVVSQELRGSVFGGVGNSPYVSGPNQMSLYLLEQGSGYSVQPGGSANSFKVTADTAPTFKQVLLLNDKGKAEAYTVTSVTGGGNTWNIQHSCTSTLSDATLAFGVNSLGFRLDNSTGTLLLSEGGQEFPMAFNITQFDLSYIYTTAGVPERKTSPLLDGVIPVKVKDNGGVKSILTEIQFTLSTKELGRGEVVRTYTGQVPLLINGDGSTIGANIFNFSGVKPCS